MPTELGEIVQKIVVDNFPDVTDTQFTARIEHELDEVETGDKQWVPVIDAFFKPFSKEVDNAAATLEKVIMHDELAGMDCEVCGSPMIVKMGRYGKFFACARFPDCRHTQTIIKEIGLTCPKCHKGQVVERKTKKQRTFYGCSRYPDCDFVSWEKPTDKTLADGTTPKETATTDNQK